jgi:hypothetical protein
MRPSRSGNRGSEPFCLTCGRFSPLHENLSTHIPPTPRPTYGRTKSGRKHAKQIQFGLNVTGDGGVPVGHLPLDGNPSVAPIGPALLEGWRADHQPTLTSLGIDSGAS